jgi:hypothetical protein
MLYGGFYNRNNQHMVSARVTTCAAAVAQNKRSRRFMDAMMDSRQSDGFMLSSLSFSFFHGSSSTGELQRQQLDKTAWRCWHELACGGMAVRCGAINKRDSNNACVLY